MVVVVSVCVDSEDDVSVDVEMVVDVDVRVDVDTVVDVDVRVDVDAVVDVEVMVVDVEGRVDVDTAVDVDAVVDVAPDATAARALPVADSISATDGGVTAAKRPAFSRKRRRSGSIGLSRLSLLTTAPRFSNR